MPCYQQFNYLYNQMLSAMRNAFPDCPHVRVAHDMWVAQTPDERNALVDSYLRDVQLPPACTPAMFSAHPLLSQLDLATKFVEDDLDVPTTWAYMLALDTCRMAVGDANATNDDDAMDVDEGEADVVDAMDVDASNDDVQTLTTAGVQQQGGSIADTVRIPFVSMCSQLLQGMRDVYPECTAVLNTCARWQQRTVQQEQAWMKRYFDEVSPLYARCEARDVSVFDEDVSFFQDLALGDKFRDGIDADTAATIWEYIKNMNQYVSVSHVCDVLPHNVVETAQSIAAGIADRISTGQMSMADIDITSLMSEIRDKVNLEELTQSVDVNMLGNNPGMFTSMLGSLMATARNANFQ